MLIGVADTIVLVILLFILKMHRARSKNHGKKYIDLLMNASHNQIKTLIYREIRRNVYKTRQLSLF